MLAGYSQVTPFTGGPGSGASHKITPAISCALYSGGSADGAAFNQSAAINCGMYSGGAGDGFDAAHTSCEEILTSAAAMKTVAEASPEDSELPTSIKLYPNPASQSATLRIEAIKPISTQLIIYRSDGMMVKSQALQLAKGVNLVRLDLHNFTSGTYFIYTGISKSRLKLLVMDR